MCNSEWSGFAGAALWLEALEIVLRHAFPSIQLFLLLQKAVIYKW